jgi:hypothetical protein
VTILSPESLSSEWAKSERAGRLAKDPGNARGSLILVKIKPCDPSVELPAHQVIDLTTNPGGLDDLIKLLVPPAPRTFNDGGTLTVTVVGYRASDLRPVLMLWERLDRFVWQHRSRCFVESHGGECLVFYGREHGEDQAVALGQLLLLGLRLAQEAAGHQLQLGLTLQWESNPHWHEIAGQRFVAGPALTDARIHRLLSDAGHIFLSPATKTLALPDPDTGATLADVLKRLRVDWHREWPTADKESVSAHEYLVHDYNKRPHRLFSVTVSDMARNDRDLLSTGVDAS